MAFPTNGGRGKHKGSAPHVDASGERDGVRSVGVSPAFFNYTPGALTVRSRGRLPHWEALNAIYFMTFRLADSLPQSVSREIEFERQDIIRTAPLMGRELSATEQKRLAQLFRHKIEARLDAGAGSCILAKPPIAKVVKDSLGHFEGIRYNLFAWCVMPNHVHALFQPIAAHSLSTILHA
jgi:putative transposase